MRVLPVNEVYSKIECSAGIAREISEHFTFDVPGARFTPAYKRGWDGKIRLFRKGFIYVGLIEELINFCEDRGYEVENEHQFFHQLLQRPEEIGIDEHIASLNIPDRFKLHDYQYEAARHCLQSERALILSPTASGKSLIIYLVATRYTRTLIVVPTTSLVGQMVSDFREYGYRGEIQEILGGKTREVHAPIVIGTWQSIIKEDPGWVNQFECIIVDEAHGAKAKSLVSIMESAIEVIYRFGFTGTLDGTETNEMVLRGLFGPVKRSISTKELMERGTIAKANIRMVLLKYPEPVCKNVRYMSYDEEIQFLTQNEARNNFIVNLALGLKGNTILLYRLLEHGMFLAEEIRKHSGSRKVYLVDGDVDAEVRNDVRKLVEKDDDAIVVASRGVFAVGVNIRRVHNLIMAHPTKSRILVPQSIGRGLRKGEGKVTCNIYDIADDLTWKGKKNYTLSHALERVAIYAENEMDYSMFALDLK